jgi:mannosylglycerate hydrolase
MVRDLQMGVDRAAAFGGAMDVGYLPDMFGHVAQMPQILHQFGLHHAVVWRGVPSTIDRTGFWWRAPDGSTVRAEYLPEGYGNGATLPDDAKELVAMVRRYEDLHADLLVGDVLWMNGTDHLMPQPWLGRVVAEANSLQDDYRFVVKGLAEHVASAPTEQLPTWEGELRSGARCNLLMGVVSNRADVRRAAAAAERGLERLAEPLSALFVAADSWPSAFLDEAWRQVVLNAAHDSSCACSDDDVVDAVLVRYAEARHLASGLTDRAVEALAASLADAGPLVVNPTGRARAGLLELRFPGHEPCPGTQVLTTDDGVEETHGLTRADCVTLVQSALDNYPHLLDARAVLDEAGVLDVRLFHDPARRQARYAGSIRAEVAALAAEAPTAPARLVIAAPPSHTAVVRAADVPGFGWRIWEPQPLDVPTVEVTADGLGMRNGHVGLTVDPADGTFDLVEHAGPGRRAAGLGRLVDGGDTGDTYNHNPPAADTVVDTPIRVEVRCLEAGPLRGRIEVVRTYEWPHRAEDDRRVGTVRTDVRTVLELQAGSPLVTVTTELDNQSRDHRLRVWLPLPERTDRSSAECAFAVVERGLTAEGGATERPLATYPSRRFVAAGGLLVVHEGLHEYELVDLDEPDAPTSAGALALTLLRATGLLSNGPMPYRPLPAGPVLATPGAQVLGPHVARYGVAFDAPAPSPSADTASRWAQAHAMADELSVPLLATRAEGGGDRPSVGSALDVSGAEVSAVRRHGSRLEVRVVNASPSPTTVTVDGRTGWLVDLRGRPVEPFEQSVDLPPWRIATLHLD